ncbi:MAG: phage holin family protein [Bacteroidota bacterium]
MNHLHLSTVLLQAGEPGWIMHIVITAVAFLAGSYVLKGVEVKSLVSALILAIVISLLNGTLGVVLKTLTLPLNWLTLGLFSFLINALMIKVADFFLDGFKVKGFINAIFLAVIVAVVNSLIEGILY